MSAFSNSGHRTQYAPAFQLEVAMTTYRCYYFGDLWKQRENARQLSRQGSGHKIAGDDTLPRLLATQAVPLRAV